MVYDHPAYYAAAYGFRDVPAEIEFALALVEAGLGRPATSAVELAAGPALHGRELLRRGLRTAAVEHNPQAAAWLAAVEPAMEVQLAGLEAFTLASPVDLALCPLSGLAYLLDDAAWLAALECVAANLVPGGLLVAELAPDDAARGEVDTWQVALPEGEMEVIAGPSRLVDEDVFEWDLTLVRPGSGDQLLTTTERQRRLSAAGVQRLLATHGAWCGVRCYAGYDRRRRYRGAGSLVVCAQRRPK
ncbi:MAG: hypothetical protein HZB16_10470 [Armatimonadetes bacterium]|nr:hypothetical protein [Armatimonadota bacterium]